TNCASRGLPGRIRRELGQESLRAAGRSTRFVRARRRNGARLPRQELVSVIINLFTQSPHRNGQKRWQCRSLIRVRSHSVTRLFFSTWLATAPAPYQSHETPPDQRE